MPRKKARKTNRKSRREEDIFDLDFDIPKIEVPETEILSLNFGFPQQKKINPNKIPKVKLVGILSKQLSTNQMYQALIRLGKHRLGPSTSDYKYGRLFFIYAEGKVGWLKS
ncbi:hypothetical protein FHEFKHOI_01059 [Candidatus Methanoperedenaceae archaeon GB50]|nr:hypothetical protein FHEFKHOI_01059 [Candidatus Methanoperedenaceae archaeon GB50]CAD7773060.1 MAG: hypothetical protein KBONHNOK_00579 [Candidatus Methanoperedenaceae archaeon GB50]